jgi:geranylgeranyl reductase family protein
MNTDRIQTDLLIVGAGPAGATTSLFLAKMGIPHTIVDAAAFPRDKVCGDGLDLKVFRVLQHLDPNITATEVFDHQEFLQSWGARIITPNGRVTDFVQPEPPEGAPLRSVLWTSKRLHFDQFLIKKLDRRFANFLPETKVEKIERDGKRWRVQARKSDGTMLEIDTPLLIGADGDHSVVLRSIGGRSIERRHYAGTLRQYWKGVSGLHPKNLIEVYLPKGLPLSYFYIFPLPNGEANVGYGMVSELIAKYKYNLRDLFKKILTEDPIMAPRFRDAEPLEEPIGWGIPLASRRRQNFGDGYLLTGDAASLVCPTSGEGIGTGMVSGYIAAHFAQKALNAKQFDEEVFKNYDREVYRRLEGEIRVFQNLMRFQPWRMYDWGLNLIAPQPYLQRAFKNLHSGWLETAFEKKIEVNLD